MEEFIKNMNLLSYSKLEYGLPPNSIFDKVLDLYNTNRNTIQNKDEKNGIQFSYILNDNIFKINYNNIEYVIEKEPFIFYSEENKLLGKVYDVQSFIKLMKRIINILEIYNDKNIELKTKNDILNNKSRKFIIKEKIKFTREKFNSLNSKRDFDPKLNEPITIPKSELSPIPLKEFHSEEKNIKLILEKRNELITYINDFMESWKKKILIIYGCDGIGKSATYIYLSNLYNSYKVLYFNLKIIMKNKYESYDLFAYEIMRYFTINVKQGNDEEKNKYNYEQYLETIKKIDKNNFNFWKEVIKFMNNNNIVNETLLIIDQYKDIYDQNSNLNELKNIILDKVTSFKLLICLSVNNTSVKNNLINELYYGSKESPIIINSEIQNNEIYNNKDSYEREIEETDLDKFNNYSKDEDDGKFDNILFFKNVENENKYKKEIKEKCFKSLKKNINKDIINIVEVTSSENNKIEIIYINELISVENIEDDYSKYLNLFDYNPKYYIKFKKFVSDKDDSMDDLHKKFLKDTEKNISEKIKEYFSGNKYDTLKNESIVELIKLKDLVNNKVRFTAPLLIKYIKEFPMKYIKIKAYNKNENDNNISNNLIKLNTKFKDKEFYFQFCFPFFGVIISKLIYMNENDYSIVYNKLSGSEKGCFIEQKIRRAFIFEQRYGIVILRYVWNFNNVVKDDQKDIFEYDFENYKKINYDDKTIDNDDIKKKKEIQNFVYYIVPGSLTNKNIDSALLIPDLITPEENHFILISFKIKQGNDFKIKNKIEYISSSFIAKKKFEELYNIKISKVFFYFILGKEFINDDDTITDLKNKKISYLFFSFISNYLYQKDISKVKNLNDLINSNAEIFKIDDKNEETNLSNKLDIINELENCLKMKKLLRKKITRNIYENGRQIFFKKDKGLRLKNKQREYIINFIKEYYNIKDDFTLKYIFSIRAEEFTSLNKYEDLFGLYYFKNNYYIIHQSFTFQLDIKKIKNQKNKSFINNNVNNNLSEINDIMKSFNNAEKSKLGSQIQNKSINLEEIKNDISIYIFKIYYL